MNVICLTHWGDTGHAASWETHPKEWLHWWREEADRLDELDTHRCPASSVVGTSCQKAAAPVGDMDRPLAHPMSWKRGWYIDVLGLGARLFLVLALLIWLGIATHDQALICPSAKNLVLDVRGVNYHCPSIRKLWRCLAGHHPFLHILRHVRSINRCLAVAIASFMLPVLFVWNLIVFHFVIVPLVLLAFLRYPIRMCRVWVFIVCIATAIYGLLLAFVQLGFAVSVPHRRPHYAMTWQIDILATNATGGVQGMSGGRCICGCDYPISLDTCLRLAVIGMATSMKSVFIALRCLKGLRRSQWANLLSVVFPVPMTVYSVDWRQPDGQPIKHRVEGMAVQEEVAFDPFAMMDEQPDGDFTTLHLAPTRVHENPSSAECLEMPSQPPPMLASNLQLAETEHIGCCGFPWPTGGRRAVYIPKSMELLSGEFPDSLPPLTPCLRTRTASGDSSLLHRDSPDLSIAEQQADIHNQEKNGPQRTADAQGAVAACPTLAFLFRLILPARWDSRKQRT